MKIIGDNLIPFEAFSKVTSIEDIKNKEEKLQKNIGKQKTFIDEKQAEIDEGNKIIAKLQKEAKGQKELFNRPS